MVGIGETGLDFHYDLSPRDIQAKVFRVHVAAARETGLPLVVHTRLADQVMGDILEAEYAVGPFRMLMHCYTSGPELAARAAALGAWFSVSGIATFKAAEDVREVMRMMPEDRIIVETDCQDGELLKEAFEFVKSNSTSRNKRKQAPLEVLCEACRARVGRPYQLRNRARVRVPISMQGLPTHRERPAERHSA